MYQEVDLKNLNYKLYLYRWANIGREWLWTFSPFLHITVVIFVQKKKKRTNTIFFYLMYCILSHALYSQVHRLISSFMSTISAYWSTSLPLGSHCLICKHSFWSRLRIPGMWYKMKTKEANASAFLSEPPLSFIIHSKTKEPL